MELREQILCGHCAEEPGEVDCAGCGLTVCAGCAAERSSCANPRAIELRLGLGARLRHVDVSGRWGLVENWRSLWYRVDLDERVEGKPSTDLVGCRLDSGGEVDHLSGRLDRSRRFLAQRESGDRVTVTDIESAPVGSLAPLSRTITPFSRKVVSQIACDDERLACAAYGEIAIFRIDRLMDELARIPLDHVDVEWLGIGGEVVAALVASGAVRRSYRFMAWRWRDREVIHEAALGALRVATADISGNGVTVAFADDASNTVALDTATGATQTLDGHSDGLSALRLSTDGRRLVTGDYDNRVIIRQCGERGFATRLERMELEQS